MEKSEKVTPEQGMKAFLQLREEARKNGLSDMSLEEINAEIAAARAERDAEASDSAFSK